MTVTSGMVAMNLLAANGTVISLVASSGDSVEFEPYSFTITPSVTNTKAVAALIEGVKFSISPGESTRFVEIDTMQNNKIAFLDRNSAAYIRIVIWGSAYLDVSSIETGSLHLQNLALKVDAQSYEAPVIDHINEDAYPDLVVKFETNIKLFDDGINYAILQGHLADGTIIKAITGPLLRY